MKNERRKGLLLQQLGTVGRKEKIGEHGQEYALSNMLTADSLFKAKVVNLILSKDTEKALELLSQHYRVAKPNLKVGMPKRHSKKLACYVAKKRVIHVSGREALYNPHVILHEFYHHLRSFSDAQRGIEKYAQKFAKNYLLAYARALAQSSDSRMPLCQIDYEEWHS